jgi:hypothetical protein
MRLLTGVAALPLPSVISLALAALAALAAAEPREPETLVGAGGALMAAG